MLFYSSSSMVPICNVSASPLLNDITALDCRALQYNIVSNRFQGYGRIGWKSGEEDSNSTWLVIDPGLLKKLPLSIHYSKRGILSVSITTDQPN
jgi:hypothetical protein